MKNRMERRVVFRCQQGLLDALEAMAKQQGISLSKLIRRLLEEKTTKQE